MMKIKTNKATGCKCVPLRAIKESAEMLWHPFSELFNNIPDNSSIHQQWKLGEVPPVFKTDCCLTKSHYKPLTILPSLSKVLEALVHSRIGPFLPPSIHPSIGGFHVVIAAMVVDGKQKIAH